MLDSSDPYALLVTHAEHWAAKTKRPLQPELIATALNLRDTHDLAPGTHWPAGSAEYLMTVRWPGHGPAGVPDVDGLVESLDTFWRFLRGTGRMSSSSAEPAALTKEAKRAKAAMRERCADPASFGAAKSLSGFADEIGISLGGATSQADLQSRLDQVMEVFNSLSYEERAARMPGPVGAGSAASARLSDLAAGMLRGDDDDLDPLGERLDPQDPAVVAAQLRASPYVQSVLALAAWLGPTGRQVTKIGVLRPAVAREAIAEFGLDDLYAELREYLPSGVIRWRSAAEHLGLDRLWTPAVEAGLISIGPKVALAGPGLPAGDDECVTVGLLLLGGLYREYESMIGGVMPEVLDVLAFEGIGELAELREWWAEQPTNPWSNRWKPEKPEHATIFSQHSDKALERLLELWRDTGVFVEPAPGRIAVTELGLDFLRLTLLLDEADGGALGGGGLGGGLDDEDAAARELLAADHPRLGPQREKGSMLLDEAIESLDSGDARSARRSVRKACRMPFDDGFGVHAGPLAAHVLLVSEILSCAQDADPDDDDWIEIAVDLIGRVDAVAGGQIAWLLGSIMRGEVKGIRIPRSWQARVQQVARGYGIVPEFGLSVSASEDERFEVAWSLLEATFAFHRVYDHDDPLPPLR